MLFLLPLTVQRSPQAQTVPLSQGMTITSSCRIKPGQYRLTSTAGLDETDPAVVAKESGLIRIHGSHITVDFSGCRIRGDVKGGDPDHRAGIAVEVEGNDVTIKGLQARGFKIGLIAKACQGLKLIDCDLSDNWKQRLFSTPEKENEVDWQSYHHNENHEWLRYGAGIYLDGCSGFEVRHCTVERGQCGLMLNRCNGGTIVNSDFSFNSGLGIGMYRSSDNKIMNNRVDWNVRGYSWGVYNRGQDSADILVFEQCMRNVIAYNSMTGGGDGFFMWAGQQTMDSGEGGCNDNIVAYNDFSSAITNGIEATFSRNKFIGNLVLECWHGVWGGYSFDTDISGNIIGLCQQGIAIEHGTDIRADGNTFLYCRPAVSLWADPPGGMPAAYLAKRPSLSKEYSFSRDVFHFGGTPPVQTRNTSDITASDCVVESESAGSSSPWISYDHANGQPVETNTKFVQQPAPGSSSPFAQFMAGSTEFNGDLASFISALKWDPLAKGGSEPRIVKPIEGGIDPFLGAYRWRGRRYIVIGEWGPYDFRQPLFLDLGQKPGSTVHRLQVIGPDGHFDVTGASGCTVVGTKSGKTGDIIEVRPFDKIIGTMTVHASFHGMEGRDVYGDVVPAGTKVNFEFSQTYQSIQWKANYFLYDEHTDPLTKPKAFAHLLQTKPVATQSLNRLRFVGRGDWAPSVRGDHYVIDAVADPNLDAGTYRLDLISDDGAKVLVDGSPVQLLDADGKPANSFKYQGATEYHQDVTLSAGRHRIEVIYFQIDGGRTLQFSIAPSPVKAAGQ